MTEVNMTAVKTRSMLLLFACPQFVEYFRKLEINELLSLPDVAYISGALEPDFFRVMALMS